MAEHSHGPRPSPRTLIANWAVYDASFTAKLRMATANTWFKLRHGTACCGNHGQPGC